MPKLERRLRSQFQTRHDWHSCRVYRSTTQSINHDTWTAISFNNQRFDTAPNDDIWVIGNPTRLTCRRAGIYQITFNALFDGGAGGVRRRVGIRLNGATYLALQGAPPEDSQIAPRSVTTLYQLAVGDFVEAMAYQDSGGALNIASFGNYTPEFGMARVG